jgi:hypothetical protein
MPNPLERRISPRYSTVKNQATLEHRSGSFICRTRATLLDISREGALVSAEATIPLAEPIRFRIESPAKTDWIAAVSVRLGELRLVGIRFIGLCPNDILLAGMLGIELGVSAIDGDIAPAFDEVRIVD